jgi:hypothetical protein
LCPGKIGVWTFGEVLLVVGLGGELGVVQLGQLEEREGVEVVIELLRLVLAVVS